MYTFTAESTHVRPTEWGAEVLRRLKERGQTQIDLIKALDDAGYPIGKVQFCRLLRGNGASTLIGFYYIYSELFLVINAGFFLLSCIFSNLKIPFLFYIPFFSSPFGGHSGRRRCVTACPEHPGYDHPARGRGDRIDSTFARPARVRGARRWP